MTERHETHSQILLVVDDEDKLLGYASREECHTGEGRRHRAFVTLLFDNSGNVLLQKRKHRLFDNLWDLTAISHPLHLETHDESFQEASDRALHKEMGIGSVEIENIGSFNYFADHGPNCENEHCSILVGIYNGDFKANPDEIYEVKKVPFEEFLEDIKKNPSNYTPWAVLSVGSLEQYRNR